MYNFELVRVAPNMYEIVASVSTFVKNMSGEQGELQSRWLRTDPNKAGTWTNDHIFKNITVQDNKGKKEDLKPETFVVSDNHFKHIYNDAKKFSDLGDHIIIHIDSF